MALVLRVVYVLQMRASPYFEDPALDQRFFVDAGRALARGAAAPAFRPPLYAWWLALSFHLFGPGLLAPRLLQAVTGTASVWLVYEVAKLAFDRRVGLVAACLAATYWVLLYYDGELLRESLVNPLNLLAVLATLRLSRRPSWSLSALAGAAWGTSALLRPQVLVVVPFFAAWLVFHSGIHWKKASAFALLCIVPLVPVALHDHAATGDAIAFTAEGGQALWSGNNPAADGVTSMSPGIRADFWGFYEDSRAQAELEEGRSLLPSQVSRHYVRKTLHWMAGQPAAAAKLLATKLRLFLTDWEFGNPEEPAFFGPRFAPIVRWLPIGFGLVLALATVGFITIGRVKLMSQFPIWGFGFVYGATIVLSLVSSRYREPILPVLLIYSACGITWILREALSRRWSPLLIASGVALVVYAGSRSYPVDKNVSAANGLCWLASAAGRAGHSDEAKALFEQALAASPSSCTAYRGLGVSYALAGRVQEGIAAFERALSICPEDLYALDGLAELYLRVGQEPAAIPLAQSSIRIAPHLHKGYYNLGRAWFQEGRLSEAREGFRLAVAKKPTDFASNYMLGIVSRSLGEEPQAIDAFEKAVSLGVTADAGFLFQAYRELVDLLAGARRTAEARSYAEAMVRRFPDRPEAGELLKRLQE